MPQGELSRAGQQGVKLSADRGGLPSVEVAARILEYVGHCPAGNHAVISCDQVAGQHAQPADGRPGGGPSRGPGDNGHGIGRALAAPSAHGDFGNQDGKSHKNNDDKVDQYESAAPVFPGDVRELPDITQAYRRTNGRQQK